MTSKEFKYHPLRLERELRSIVQQKLKTVMKCYTITNLKLDENEKIFTFNKSHKIKGIRMDDKKLHNGKYNIENIDEETSRIIISV